LRERCRELVPGREANVPEHKEEIIAYVQDNTRDEQLNTREVYAEPS